MNSLVLLFAMSGVGSNSGCCPKPVTCCPRPARCCEVKHEACDPCARRTRIFSRLSLRRCCTPACGEATATESSAAPMPMPKAAPAPAPAPAKS
jgi:hypothetical protein